MIIFQGTKGERGISIRGPPGFPGAPGLVGLPGVFGSIGPIGMILINYNNIY